MTCEVARQDKQGQPETGMLYCIHCYCYCILSSKDLIESSSYMLFNVLLLENPVKVSECNQCQWKEKKGRGPRLVLFVMKKKNTHGNLSERTYVELSKNGTNKTDRVFENVCVAIQVLFTISLTRRPSLLFLLYFRCSLITTLILNHPQGRCAWSLMDQRKVPLVCSCGPFGTQDKRYDSIHATDLQ